MLHEQSPSPSTSDVRTRAPDEGEFPAYPASWYVFCLSRELRNGPRSKRFLGRRLVAFRIGAGTPVIMDAACAHLGCDLGKGKVIGETIECPFHNWRFGLDGRCVHIPAQKQIPPLARQTCYPVVERHGMIFMFNGRQPRFALPFFPDCDPQHFIAGKPFGTELDCPWYMTAANAFDLQHFRAAHERRMLGDPEVDRSVPYAFSSSARFKVAGHGWRDGLTRRFAGDEVVLGITDWCGTLSFATASFRRANSYGLVAREPLASGGVRIQVIVYIPRSAGSVRRALLDPASLSLRRYFIRKFLTEDAIRLDGVRYQRDCLIECDREMVEYFRWLTEIAGDGPTTKAAPIQADAFHSEIVHSTM